MDRFNDQKINQYLTEFGREAQELDKEMREATTIEKEKPPKIVTGKQNVGNGSYCKS